MIWIDLLFIYFITGLVLAVWFSFFKIQKTPSGASGITFWFRLIIMPGTILLWPWVICIIYLKHKPDKSNT